MAQGFYFSQPLPKAKITAKRKERGLEFESPAEHAFYQKIGQVNVLNAPYPLSGSNCQELVENVPVMVFLDKGGDFDIIYAKTRLLKAGLRPSVSRVKITRQPSRKSFVPF